MRCSSTRSSTSRSRRRQSPKFLIEREAEIMCVCSHSSRAQSSFRICINYRDEERDTRIGTHTLRKERISIRRSREFKRAKPRRNAPPTYIPCVLLLLASARDHTYIERVFKEKHTHFFHFSLFCNLSVLHVLVFVCSFNKFVQSAGKRREEPLCVGGANGKGGRGFVIAEEAKGGVKGGRCRMVGQPSRELERLIKKFSLPVRFICT